MKQIFETLFIALSFVFVSWLVINTGLKFEIKIADKRYGFTIGGLDEKQKQELQQSTFIHLAKDSIVYLSGLYERADSAFLVEKFFPVLKQYYDTVRIYKLKSFDRYTVTGGIFLIYYSGLNFQQHNTAFVYNENHNEDSLFYGRMLTAKLSD